MKSVLEAHVMSYYFQLINKVLTVNFQLQISSNWQRILLFQEMLSPLLNGDSWCYILPQPNDIMSFKFDTHYGEEIQRISF